MSLSKKVSAQKNLEAHRFFCFVRKTILNLAGFSLIKNDKVDLSLEELKTNLLIRFGYDSADFNNLDSFNLDWLGFQRYSVNNETIIEIPPSYYYNFIQPGSEIVFIDGRRDKFSSKTPSTILPSGYLTFGVLSTSNKPISESIKETKPKGVVKPVSSFKKEHRDLVKKKQKIDGKG